ncbi:hypothetical protein ACWDOP_30790 [Nocardia sp. NPDC003693]
MTSTLYEPASPPPWVGQRSAAWNLLTADGIAQSSPADGATTGGRVHNVSVRDGVAAALEYARTRNVQELLSGSAGNQVKPIADPLDALIDPGPSPADIGPPKPLAELAVPVSEDERATTPPKTESPPKIGVPPGSPGADGKTPDLPDVRADIRPVTPPNQPAVEQITPLPEGITPEMAVLLGVAKTPEPTPQPLDLLDVVDIGARGLPGPGNARTLPSSITLETNAEGTAMVWKAPSGDSFTTAPPSIKRIVQQADLQKYNENAVGLLPADPYRPSSYTGIGADGPVEIRMPSPAPAPAMLNDPTPAEVVQIQRPDGTFGFGVVNAAGQFLYESDAIGREVAPPEVEKRWWEHGVSFGAGLANPVVESVKDLGAKVGIGGPGVKKAWLDTFYGMGSLVGLGAEGGPGVWDSWKALGKDTLAWDDWANGDYAYALGKLTFNVGSLFFSGGTAAFLKLDKLGSSTPHVRVDAPDKPDRIAFPNLPIRAGDKPEADRPSAVGDQPPQPNDNQPDLKGGSTQPDVDASPSPNPASLNPSQEPSLDSPSIAPDSSIAPKPNLFNGIGNLLQQPGNHNGLTGRLDYEKTSNGLAQKPFRQDPLVGASVPRRTPDKVDRDAATPDRSDDAEPIRLSSDRDGTPAKSDPVTAETDAVFNLEDRGTSRSGGSAQSGRESNDGETRRRPPRRRRGNRPNNQDRTPRSASNNRRTPEEIAKERQEYVARRLDEIKNGGPKAHGYQRHFNIPPQHLIERLGEPVWRDPNNPGVDPELKGNGFVNARNHIDPARPRPTTEREKLEFERDKYKDMYKSGRHSVGAFATSFTDGDAFVRAADYALEEYRRTQRLVVRPFSIEDALGPDGHKAFIGYYFDPNPPHSPLPIDFRRGKISAEFKLDENGDPYLYTMYADPHPNRHP